MLAVSETLFRTLNNKEQSTKLVGKYSKVQNSESNTVKFNWANKSNSAYSKLFECHTMSYPRLQRFIQIMSPTS